MWVVPRSSSETTPPSTPRVAAVRDPSLPMAKWYRNNSYVPSIRSTIKLFLNELYEGAEACLRVDERDRRATAPRAGLLVDDLCTVRLHRLQHLTAVLDAIADVMDALTT